jgi:hypothetical protein
MNPGKAGKKVNNPMLSVAEQSRNYLKQISESVTVVRQESYPNMGLLHMGEKSKTGNFTDTMTNSKSDRSFITGWNKKLPKINSPFGSSIRTNTDFSPKVYGDPSRKGKYGTGMRSGSGESPLFIPEDIPPMLDLIKTTLVNFFKPGWELVSNIAGWADSSIKNYLSNRNAHPAVGDALNGLVNPQGLTLNGLAQGAGTLGAGTMAGMMGGTELGTMTDPLTGFALALGEAIGSIENVAAILNPFGTMLKGFTKVVGGPLNKILAHSVEVLMKVGEVLGAFLLPILLSVGFVFEGVAQLLAVPINALIEFSNYIIDIMNGIFGVFGVKIAHINKLFDEQALTIEDNLQITSAAVAYLQQKLKEESDKMKQSFQTLYEVGAISASEYQKNVKAIDAQYDGAQDPLVSQYIKELTTLPDIHAELVKMTEQLLQLNKDKDPAFHDLELETQIKQLQYESGYQAKYITEQNRLSSLYSKQATDYFNKNIGSKMSSNTDRAGAYKNYMISQQPNIQSQISSGMGAFTQSYVSGTPNATPNVNFDPNTDTDAQRKTAREKFYEKYKTEIDNQGAVGNAIRGVMEYIDRVGANNITTLRKESATGWFTNDTVDALVPTKYLSEVYKDSPLDLGTDVFKIDRAALNTYKGKELFNTGYSGNGSPNSLTWAQEYISAINSAGAFASGTPNLPSDMFAQVHKGETIIPKNFADGIRNGDLSLSGPGANSGQQVNNYYIRVEGSIVKENDLIDSLIKKGNVRLERGYA